MDPYSKREHEESVDSPLQRHKYDRKHKRLLDLARDLDFDYPQPSKMSAAMTGDVYVPPPEVDAFPADVRAGEWSVVVCCECVGGSVTLAAATICCVVTTQPSSLTCRNLLSF